ncbi:hypothetical protein LSTR_LSTR005922 [Laodelphax striatellus]|uniref:HTH OST-type domain-containing protein n=1 Tax=Laodelphax striatellus TaxID=195883 RepID=A0A482WGR6_LAOST|nr:hypothetical protein LSTR_LSTR005922 [Laodelphax striatellus]
MASQSEKASVISTLRACILSCKGGIQINALDRDYRSLVGTPIPYKSLGYSSLEEFVKDAPDLYLTKGAHGEKMVNAELAESSAHIAAMVNRQKSTSKGKARSRPPPQNWGSSKWSSKPRYPSSRPPPPRYSAPARMTTPPPPPRESRNNVNAKTPLSITIGV